MLNIGLMGWWVGCAPRRSTRRGPGAGAVEAVRNAVVLPTPGVEAWRAAVREAVYAMREVQYVRETVNWTVLLKKRPRRPSAPPAA